MSPKLESRLPEMPPFDTSKPASEGFIARYQATKARQEKAKAFEKRIKNDQEFRSKIEERRALVRDLEQVLAGLDLDIELRGPVQMALWKSVEDDEYARELFGAALRFTKSGGSKAESADVMERVQNIPKKELAHALVKAINLAHTTEIKRRSEEAA